MRIALLHYTQPPVVGGVEQVIGDQARALLALGHEAEIFTRAEWIGGPWDVVIVHNVFCMPFDPDWTLQLVAEAAQSNAVWVNWIHDVAGANPAYAHLNWPMPVPQALPVTVSDLRAREWAAATGTPIEQLNVIPNGVDPARVLGLTDRVASLAASHGLWQADLVLLLPARLVRRKNIELGIDLLADFRANGVDARLIVTGAPDPHQEDGRRYFEELQARSLQHGVGERIVFAGASGTLSDEDVTSLYRLCDALLFPSLSEGFGLPLLEATLHRLPVWCADTEIHRQVALKGTRFFDPADPAGLGSQMKLWLQDDPTPASRRMVWWNDWLSLCKERLEPLLGKAIKGQ